MSEQRPKVLATRKFPADIEARLQRRISGHAERDRPDLPARGAGGRGPRARRGHVLPVGALQPRGAGAGGGIDRHHRDLFGRVTSTSTCRPPEDVGIVVTYTPDVLTDATADTAMLCILAAARRGAECDPLSCGAAAGTAGTRCSCSAPTSPASASGSSAWGGSARPSPSGRGASTCPSTTTTGAGFPRTQEQGATFHADPADLLSGERFPLHQLPVVARDRRVPQCRAHRNAPRGGIRGEHRARQHCGRRGAHRGPSFSGRVAAAGLDVFDNEPNLHPGYLDLDNVFMLPHVGSATHETRTAMGDTCLANLAAFFAGRPCPQALT